MKLTKVQARTYKKLTDKWQSAKKLQERLTTLNMLVSAGMAERHYNPDSHFTENVKNKYKLSQQIGFCENDVLGVLTDSFPQWTWAVKHGSLIFTVIASYNIVSYIHNVACASLQSDEDIKQAGREAIAGLREAVGRIPELADALRRHERGTDGKQDID